MGILMTWCPATRSKIFIEIATDPVSLARPDFTVTLRCPLCASDHLWARPDAGIKD